MWFYKPFSKLFVHGSFQVTRESLGKRAPVLVRHCDVTMCMLCGDEFTALRRKRHCQACGVVRHQQLTVQSLQL